MSKAAVIGAWMTRFGKHPDRKIEDIAAEAIMGAFKHAGVSSREIDAVYVGNVLNPTNVGQRILDKVGMAGLPTFNFENACGSGSAAFHTACWMVTSGKHDRVLVIGAEHMTSSQKGLLQFSEGTFLPADMGMTSPSIFSFVAMRHMAKFGTTAEQLAMISVKNHQHSTMNPFAQYQKAMTREEVLQSVMICDPLTLMQCTPIGDGAAAVIVTTEKLAKQYTNKPVTVESSIFTCGKLKTNTEVTTFESCVRASRDAYEDAGIGPEDLDVIELHDCFTAHELIAVEDLGLCSKGEGGRMAEEGTTALGGKIPVNPSGGLLSKGHPLGATGVAQIVELVWQLRGECNERQVQGAKVALSHNGGGLGPCMEPGMMNINILTRS